MTYPPIPEGLVMWTVYDHPEDYPNEFLARMWVVPTGPGVDHEPIFTGQIMASTDLHLIRRWMQHQGLACITRNPDDDPVILETWL